MSQIQIQPLYDKIVVRRLEDQLMSPGGIVIPDNAAEKPTRGEVLAVGPGKVLDNGDQRALSVKVGDRVIFGKYSGTEIKINGQEVVIMSEIDVLGIVKG